MKVFPLPINWPIAYLAGWFWLLETLYFGFNWMPESAAEILADGIVFLLVGLALPFGTPVKPRLTIRRLLGQAHTPIGLVVTYNGDVEVIRGEDLQA